MPYKVVGKNVYHKKGGKWKIKQRSKSAASAKRAKRLLYAVDHGWKPTGGKAKKVAKKKTTKRKAKKKTTKRKKGY